MFYIQFLQFIFYKQLDEITAYARKKGLRLMQDVPFYVNMNSMEVWSHKREFMVQPDGRPIQLAGCPPDHYHEHGQVWDKPMYNFDYIKEEQYVNFRNRFIWTARNFDAMRIVHFKGFDFIWKVPEDRNPEHGAWSAGPGRPLLEMIKNDLPNVLFTAEDQGLMRPTLKEMEKEFSIPVMDVLQYRMETKLLKKAAAPLSAVYTSFYDTPTIEQDYASFTNNRKIALRRFFKKREYEHRSFHDLVCHFAINSEAVLVLLAMQDILGIKEQGRINDPENEDVPNWTWKLKDFKTFPDELQKVKGWLEAAGRIPAESAEEA